MRVQQEPKRETTMNVYGSAILDSKRSANSKIVRLILTRSLRRRSEKGRSPVGESLLCGAEVVFSRREEFKRIFESLARARCDQSQVALGTHGACCECLDFREFQ